MFKGVKKMKFILKWIIAFYKMDKWLREKANYSRGFRR